MASSRPLPIHNLHIEKAPIGRLHFVLEKFSRDLCPETETSLLRFTNSVRPNGAAVGGEVVAVAARAHVGFAGGW